MGLPFIDNDTNISLDGFVPCAWCSSGTNTVFHVSYCPRVKAIEYHANGTIKRVEFKDENRNN